MLSEILARLPALHPASWDCTRRQCFLKFNLPLLLTTYRCHYRQYITARPSVDCQISYLTPTSTSTSGIFHRGSLHHLTPIGAVAPSSAAPSSLPLFLHKAVVSRTGHQLHPIRSQFLGPSKPKINSSGLLPDITKSCQLLSYSPRPPHRRLVRRHLIRKILINYLLGFVLLVSRPPCRPTVPAFAPTAQVQ